MVAGRAVPVIQKRFTLPRARSVIMATPKVEAVMAVEETIELDF